MASATFLELTNRVLNALNEVPLTSSDFSSAIGFYAEAKNAVNQGLFDVYAHEGVEWPFLFNSLTFTANRGIINYTKSASVIKGAVDWNSFRILRGTATVSSITQTGGVATVTTSGAHGFVTGDSVAIDGADQTGYNLESTNITVTSTTTFTYSVDSATVSPATGTITCNSNTVLYKRLQFIDTNEYKNTYAGVVENYNASSYRQPYYVAPDKTENFIIFPAPDRAYTVKYDAFVMPDKLSAYSDTHVVPEQWEQAIVDMAMYRAYMFRDNMEQAKIAEDTGLRLIRQMRKALMPVQPNVNWG